MDQCYACSVKGIIMRLIAAIAASALFTVPAYAKARFEPYEARNPIVDGRGGTRTTKNGIDYWTHGEPPRRFKILGMITDKRGTGRFAGDAIGSASVAKLTKKVGGDAVIFLTSSTRAVGAISGGQAQGYGNQAYGSGWTDIIERATTKLAVVKYLDEPSGEPASPPTNTGSQPYRP